MSIVWIFILKVRKFPLTSDPPAPYPYQNIPLGGENIHINSISKHVEENKLRFAKDTPKLFFLDTVYNFSQLLTISANQSLIVKGSKQTEM